MKRLMAMIGIASVLLAVACDDTRQPLGPSSAPPLSAPPSAQISDGRFIGGNDDFFFLPPLMPDPGSETHYDAAGFNGNLGPTVKICQLAASPVLNPATDCALDANSEQILVASFAPSQVSVSTDRYQVNWHTDESALLVDRFYRLQVFLGAVRIGYADLDPVTSGRDLKNAVTGQTIGLVDGRTLPIAFRIENGVLCTNKTDCAEFRVTNEGGLFVTNTKDAGIQFKPGFLPAGVDEITLTIERVNVGPDNRCHGEASARLWVEFEGCYEMTSDPDLRPYGGIQQPGIAGQCVEVSTTDPLYPFLQPYKSHNGGELQRLASAPATFLDCEGFDGSSTSAAPARNALVRFALAGLGQVRRGFGKAFGVRTLNAIDLGLGAELPIGTALSRFDWAVGLEVAGSGGVEQTVGFGLQAPQPLELHLKSLHFHPNSTGDDVDDDHPEDVPGVPVQFTVTEGDGYFELDEELGPVRTKQVSTNADGRALVSFVAASNSATNVVTARAPTLDGEEELTTFVVSGLPPDLGVGALTRSVAAPTTADPLSWSFDVTNVGAGAAIPSVARLVVTYLGEGEDIVATYDFNVPRLVPGASASFSTASLPGPHAPGPYRVIVRTNATGTVEEIDGENNTLSEAFNVAVPVVGQLVGTVTEISTGQPLAGALVSIVGTNRSAVTSATGGYVIANVPAGTYTVQASFINFDAATTSVTIGAGGATANFTLLSQLPYIALSPAPPLVVSAVPGGSPIQRTVTIANGGGGTLAGVSMQFVYPTQLVCDTCQPPTIVGVTLDNTVSPAVVTVTAHIDETIPTGDYPFVFTVSSTNSANGPVTYPFIVRVVTSLPPILVDGDGCGPLACVPPE